MNPNDIIFCESVEILSYVVASGFASAVLVDTPGIRVSGVEYIPVEGYGNGLLRRSLYGRGDDGAAAALPGDICVHVEVRAGKTQRSRNSFPAPQLYSMKRVSARVPDGEPGPEGVGDRRAEGQVLVVYGVEGYGRQEADVYFPV